MPLPPHFAAHRPVIPGAEGRTAFSSAPRPDDGAYRVLARLYPRLFPLLESTTPITRISAEQIVNAAATVNLIEFGPVGSGQFFLITRFGAAAAAFADLRWDFLVNGAPVEPVRDLAGQYGTIAAPTELPGAGLLLVTQEALAVQVRNTGVANVSGVAARIDGFLWRAE